VKKISINSPCPCGSGNKYKKCCQKFHNGALASTALLLMKSRYSAYAMGNANYIINTTHSNNIDFTDDKKAWKSSIIEFCKNSKFISLEILNYTLKDKNEAFVTFKASFENDSMIEKSRFLFENGRWFYEKAISINFN